MITFYSIPTSFHLIPWIIPSSLCTKHAANWGKNWFNLAAYHMVILWRVAISNTKNRVKEGIFRMTSCSFIELYAQIMEQLIPVKYREKSSLNQLLELPQKSIESIFEWNGHIELWNSDSESLKFLNNV